MEQLPSQNQPNTTPQDRPLQEDKQASAEQTTVEQEAVKQAPIEQESLKQTPPKKKKKWLLNTLFLLALLALFFIYQFQNRKPQLRQDEFRFSYGKAIPSESQHYLNYGDQYEDVSFADELAEVNAIGDYEIEVRFADQTYTLCIHVVDDSVPIITFSDRDNINLYLYEGKRYLDPIYTITEDSDYKISLSPSLEEMDSGIQDICVTVIDDFANENTQCKQFDVWKIEPNLVTIPDVKNVEELLAQFIKKHRLNTANFGFYYDSPYDEETYIYNPDRLFYAASIIKVPLNMLLEDRYESGEMHPQDTIALLKSDVESGGGYTVKQHKFNEKIAYEYLQEQSVVYSDNTATNMLVRALGGFTKFRKLIAEYSDQPLPNAFYTQNVITMEYMLTVMKKLYARQDHYQALIGYMKQASEGEFLQTSTDLFEIAQKYGDYDNNLHVTGIVYTPKPYIVGIYTYKRNDADEIIKELNEWLIAYQFQKSVREIEESSVDADQ